MLLAAPVAAWAGSAAARVAASSERKDLSSAVTLQRLAWAGVKLELPGVALFVDAIPPDPANGQPGPELSAGEGRNYALVTHHHGDHCDPKALAPLLGSNGYLVCYEETARYFDTRLISVQTTRMYEPVFLSRGAAEFVAFAVPAEDGLGSPQVSWVIDACGRRVIHCGDTRWHGHWWDIARAYGPFDVALLPINAFRQVQGRFTDEGVPMSMTAREAAAAAHVLGAHTAIPIHYGSRGEVSYRQDPNSVQSFLTLAAEKGIRAQAVAPGEVVTLQGAGMRLSQW
jgi:L-ascorbate metabolism protein UlaG (beta-lactamase superfamily)